MRKLATIAEIESVGPIKGADRIEVVTLVDRAWKCVVGKDEFKQGDPVVFFEIDSFIPAREPYLFLDGRCNKTMDGEAGYRLKTIKLRQQISQGLVMPLSVFDIPHPKIDDDVTEALGIKLYEPPVHVDGVRKGNFPIFIQKSDQNRLENLMKYFHTMKDVEFEATLKMDGSSMSLYHNVNLEESEQFSVCSHNVDLKNVKEKAGNDFWKVAQELDLERRMAYLCENIMIQGELCGGKIQSNRMNLDEQQLFIYDIFDISTFQYVSPRERCRMMLLLNDTPGEDILHVPILKRFNVFNYFKDFSEVQEWVQSVPGLNGTVPEGVVFKSMEPVDGEIISFKVINNKYLLKHDI